MHDRSEVRFGADRAPDRSRSTAPERGPDEFHPEAARPARATPGSPKSALRRMAALGCAVVALSTAACTGTPPSLAAGAGAAPVAAGGPPPAVAPAASPEGERPFWQAARSAAHGIPALPLRLLSSLGLASWAEAPGDAPREVVSAVRSASDATGLDPAFLMVVAWKESRFDPAASNPRSSADGLLQFTAGTWMGAVRDFGDRHGIGHLAARAPQARGQARREILRLRRDPRLSAALAAEMIRREGDELAEEVGRPVNLTDLYLTHRLGTAGAARFLRALSRTPGAPSSTVVPNAGRSGRALTVAQAYAAYSAEIEVQRRRFAAVLLGYEEVAEAR